MKKTLVNQRDGYKIYVVDGNYIRTNVNEEFTNFGQHYRFPFIPVDEIWLDKEYGKGDEREPFEAHAIKEAEAMRNGMDYDKAYDEGLEAEAKYRKEAKGKVYKRVLMNVGNVQVWLVDGKKVRSGYDMNFTGGGHSKVYGFIPKNEVWIDDDLSEKERYPYIVHELNELGLMRKGMKYNPAHRRSSNKESKFRKLFRRHKVPSLVGVK